MILAWFDESQQPVIQAAFNEGKRLVTASTHGREKLHQESITDAIFKLNHLAETSVIQQNLVILNFFFSKPYEASDSFHRKELESVIGEALAAAREAVQLYQQATRTFGYDFPKTLGKLKWMGKLARLCAAEPHPLPNWFDPAGMAKTRACLQEAMKASVSHAKSVARIQTCWNDEVIASNVEEINKILDENTQPSLKRMFNGEYKAWQKGILRFWRAPRNASQEDLLILLQDLKAIQKSEGWFAKNSTFIYDLLGPRFSGLHSDFAGISKALDQTQQIIKIFSLEFVPAEVKKILCEGSVSKAEWILLADQLEQVSGRLPKALEKCENEFNREFLNRVGNGDALNLETAYGLLLDVNQKLLSLNGKFDNLAAVFQSGAPSFGKLLEVLKIADEVVKAEGNFYAKSDLFRQYFGSYYAGLKTDWTRLSQSLKVAFEIFDLLNEAEKISTHYSSASPNILPYAKKICLKQDLQKDARAILKVGIIIEKHLDQQLADLLSYFTGLDEEFDHTALDDVLFSFLQKWAKNLLETIDSIPTWQRFANANQGIIQQGLKDFPLEIHTSENSKLDLLPDIIRKRIYALWLLEAYNRLPAAGNLKINQHRQTIQSFRELDQRLIAEQKLRVLTAWNNNLPAITQSVPVSQVADIIQRISKEKSSPSASPAFRKDP